MGELADRVDDMHIQVSAPDGGITAELRGRDQLSLTFREGLYRLFDDEAELERRLTALAGRLWVARTRAYWRIYADVTDDRSTGEDPPVTPQDRDWRAERDELEVTGTSADKRITVRATGMRQWQVSIRRGTLRELDERQFTAAVAQAAEGLIRDQFTQLAALSNKHYGDGR